MSVEAHSIPSQAEPPGEGVEQPPPPPSAIPTAVITNPEHVTRPSNDQRTPLTVNTFHSEPHSHNSAAAASNPDLGSRPRVNEPIAPGDRIADRYDVLSVLGEGGMGIVYRCVDRHTDREVAVKQVIIPKGSSPSDYLAWFYKEARAQASLDHPGIVRAVDFGQLVGGSPYLAMALVHGHSLHDLGQVQLSYPVVWSIVDQVLGALAHAHARGVIHGDLKPSNVLVAPGENKPPRMHILDFGLAWIKEDPHDERLDGTEAMVFLPHAGAGTPGYMAPEQIQHEMHHVCGATDLYAVGCLIYRLLSGKAPFAGSTSELLQKHAYELPPKPRFKVPVPDGVAQFTMRLLEKRPWDRYEFAAEARRAWKTLAPQLPLPEGSWVFPISPLPPPTDVPTPAPQEGGPRHYQSISAGPSGLLSIRASPLVGRETLRNKLRNVAQEMIDGKGAPHRLVLLLGPAGVGKTRLAEWLASDVHEDGRMVPLTVRYRRLRSSSNGMVGAVSRHFNFEQADRLTVEASLMARWRPSEADTDLRAWIAGAAEWLRPTPPGASHPIGPSGVRFRVESPGMRRQVTGFTIRKIAAGRPLLFVLDDLHHAPETVVDGLLRIHASELDQPIFVVATVRTEDVQLGSPIANEIRSLRKALDGEVLQVLPMSPEETCDLVHTSMPLDNRAVQEAARRSRGFPLFALQQLHAWAHAGSFTLSHGAYTVSDKALEMRPATTAELWDERLATLTEKEALAACAVATLGIDMRVIVLFALLDTLQLSPASSIEALRRAEIILPRGSERYTWPHALLQEHLMRRLHTKPEAPRIFEAAANALTKHPLVGTLRVMRQRLSNLLDANQPEKAADVCFHFLSQSTNGTLQPRATLSDLELLSGKLQGAYEARYDRWRAEFLRYAGEAQSARVLATRACVAFGQLKIRDEEAHCNRLLGQLESRAGNLASGLALVEKALDAFTAMHHTIGVAQCEAAMASIQCMQGSFLLARRSARSAAEHFLTTDQMVGHGRCLLRLCWIAHHEGRMRRARRLTFEARQALESAGYRAGLAETTVLIAHIEHRISNFFTAMQKGREALALFDALGAARGKADSERLLAMIEIDTDDMQAAAEHARNAAAAYRLMGEPGYQGESLVILAQTQIAARSLDQARLTLEQALPLLGEEPALQQHALLTQSWFNLEAGSPEKAFELLSEASKCFPEPLQVGEHTSQLLGRLSRLNFEQPAAAELIIEWRRAIDDADRRDRD